MQEELKNEMEKEAEKLENELKNEAKELEDNKEDEETEWVKDQPEEDAEVVKLDIGESIQGLLVDKFHSGKYDAGIYKIKSKDCDKIQIVLGTTILDKLMIPKIVGDEVKIKRLEDSVNPKGQSYQNWETYHLHKSSSAKKG